MERLILVGLEEDEGRRASGDDLKEGGGKKMMMGMQGESRFRMRCGCQR